jgi:hypothetical protein
MAMRMCWTIVLAGALGACVDDPGPPYRAEVLSYSGFDLEEERSRYELGVRDLGSLDDLETLDGRWFRLHRGGELVVREVDGELIDDGRFTGGDQARLRYQLEGDVLIPRDYTSLGLLSAFHEMEQVFAALEEATGVSADDLTAGGRFDVFFEPRIKAESGSATLKANAFFVPGARQFGLARRSAIETVPLAVDRLVLAHEVGHALFQQLFFAGGSPECEPGAVTVLARLDHEYVIAGFNEGFADWISFSITGATNPLASLPFAGDARSLTGARFGFRDLGDDRTCDGRFYCIGTLLSRALYVVFRDLGADPESPADRGAFTALVTATLANTPQTLAERDSLPPLATPVDACERAATLRADDELIAGAFLDALATNLPEELRRSACDAFIAGFGSDGFPSSTRLTCAAVTTP